MLGTWKTLSQYYWSDIKRLIEQRIIYCVNKWAFITQTIWTDLVWKIIILDSEYEWLLSSLNEMFIVTHHRAVLSPLPHFSHFSSISHFLHFHLFNTLGYSNYNLLSNLSNIDMYLYKSDVVFTTVSSAKMCERSTHIFKFSPLNLSPWNELLLIAPGKVRTVLIKITDKIWMF